MKQFYPYVLPPTDPYHFNAIPVFGTFERIEFFYKYKRASENLYIGNINAKHLKFSTASSHLSRVENYFLQKQYLDSEVPNDITKRLVPKLCWLTDSLFKTGFKYPVCVHYNPRIKENVIHPGSIRNLVINLFQTDYEVSCLYFNTGGVNFDFMQSLQIFSKDELSKYTKNLEIELVADHGAIIPHINLDGPTSQVAASAAIIPNVSKWHEFVYRRLISPSFTIFCNIDIGMLKPWYVAKVEDAEIEININPEKLQVNEVYDDIICKAVILSIIGKSYSSPALTIKHKLSFSTPS